MKERETYDVLLGDTDVHVVSHRDQEFSHAVDNVAECELPIGFEFERGPFHFVNDAHLLQGKNDGRKAARGECMHRGSSSTMKDARTLTTVDFPLSPAPSNNIRTVLASFSFAYWSDISKLAGREEQFETRGDDTHFSQLLLDDFVPRALLGRPICVGGHTGTHGGSSEGLNSAKIVEESVDWDAQVEERRSEVGQLVGRES